MRRPTRLCGAHAAANVGQLVQHAGELVHVRPGARFRERIAVPLLLLLLGEIAALERLELAEEELLHRFHRARTSRPEPSRVHTPLAAALCHDLSRRVALRLVLRVWHGALAERMYVRLPVREHGPVKDDAWQHAREVEVSHLRVEVLAALLELRERPVVRNRPDDRDHVQPLERPGVKVEESRRRPLAATCKRRPLRGVHTGSPVGQREYVHSGHFTQAQVRVQVAKGLDCLFVVGAGNLHRRKRERVERGNKRLYQRHAA
mmetsp:Transcript_93928/g.269002  ORF Transcript_93928/g.269002 Transcript_93928/m.269002 type:complete len:262 (+) Transcript_93928:311-1096(+)